MALNPVLSGATQLATNQVSVKTTTTSIIGPRDTRRGVSLMNLTGTDTVYVGTETGVSSTAGYVLPPVQYASIYIPTSGALFGLVATTTQTVAVIEIYD